MATITEQARKASRGSVIGSPLGLLAAMAVVLAGLLLLPITVPIGPMYWDVFIYFDAANRIFDGQVPSNDFFTPVGPLGYYVFAGAAWLFPNAQPALLAHWCWLIVTAPLMALVVQQVDQRSRGTAFALLVPFLVFAVLPFNTRDFYPYPGSDGFGIYNRQASQLLYVLAAALIFVRNQRVLALVVTLAMLALFFGKITGAVAGGLLCAFAFLTGRISLRHALASALGFLAVLAIIEFATGLVSNYVADILALVAMNESTLAPRFVQSASLNFGVAMTGLLLATVVLYAERQRLASAVAGIRQECSARAVAKLLDNDAFWLVAVLFAGIFFETQNTGSQAMILVWPAVLAVLLKAGRMFATPKILIATMALAGACVLPPLVNTVERAARTYGGAAKNVELPHGHLKTLGAVSARPEVMQRAMRMLPFLAEHREPFDRFVGMGELPAPLLYSDFDFQIGHLVSTDRAVGSLLDLEQQAGIRFETIMNLNFVNPYPWLMDRSAPMHLAIGADPYRAVPETGSQELEAVRNVDIALLPTCPLTTANARLLELYGEGLKDHTRIRLDDCNDAFVHPRLAGELPAR
ncbi:hypothetical protein [Mesorhizobium sp. KR2-14]|uniref:hypothetical protein n=1 Tax=Mesorhizobium sp. KR2-14 TaxID=3156610 RepID=UPI0032B5B156